MKIILALFAMLLITTQVLAQIKPCEELRSEIDAKIKANGVAVYSLDIVANADVKENEGKVVGSCNNGTQKIVYKRGGAPAAPEASSGAQSQPK